MKARKIRFQKSFIFTCAVHFLGYSLILFLIYMIISSFIQTRLSNAFPVIEDLLKYDDVVNKDDFSKIPARLTRICDIIIFDEDGRTIYASDRAITEKISAENLVVISSCDGTFYSVYEKDCENNQPCYLINLNEQDADTGRIRILGSCTLDEDLNILSGELFSDKDSLTKEEFQLLQGIYTSNKNIVKYEYENDLGEYRAMVFISPQMTAQSYDKVMGRASRMWLMAIPLIAIVILIEGLLFTRKVRSSFLPLNEAVANYEKTQTFKIDTHAVPVEFQPITQNFTQLLNRLTKVQKEKEEIYKERQRIITDISHDLKTPLTVIQGYAKAFMENMIPEDKKDKYLSVIYNRSVLAAGLIDTLFDYVRMGHPQYQANMEELELTGYISGILAEKYSEIENSQCFLEVDIQDAPIHFCGDKKLLRRLIENLIGNALKYNPPETTIYVSLNVTDQAICLTVADNGAGIPKDISDQVFAPFVTGSAARTSGDGTGLGLAIVRQIVEIHGGNIQLVPSTESHYATEFKITFPYSRQNIP